MAETSKNKIYYNDNENSVADVLADMKKMAESTDEAIEKSKYNDAAIKKSISDVEKKQVEKDTEQDSKIVELQTEKAKLETELKEMQEDFYQNSIRGQASGEYIHVEDSSNCRSIIGICGNHEQETREGYNLLDLTSLIGKTETKNGITYKINEDCSITVNGTPTDYTSFNLLNMSLKAGTYKFTDGLNSNNVFLQSIGDFSDTSQNRTFSLAEDGKATVYLVILAGTPILNNITLYPMIYEGTEDKPYEQYGVMPSPDYLSSIVAVGSNVNLFDKDNMTIGKIWNGATLLDSDVGNASPKIPVTAGKTYIRNAGYSSNYIIKENNSVVDVQGGTNAITMPEDAKYWMFNIPKDIDINTIKAEEGSISTPQSKHGQGCVKVTKCNKNILKNTAVSGELNGVNRTVKEDGSVIINGTSTGWANLTVETIQGDGNSYTLSGSLSNSEIFLSVNNSQEGDIAQSKNGNEITFIPKRGLTYNVIICIPSGKTFNNVLIKPLVRISSDKDNTYEQHEEQSYIMPTQKEMLQGDYFDFDNEEEVHVWGNVIVNGTETINKNSNSEFFSITKSMSQFDTSANAIKQSISNYGAGTTLGLGSGNTNNKYSFNASTIYLDCYNSNINTVEKLKAQLTENNMKIYAKLATPQRIAFTEEQKAVAKELNNARTYKNVTNITTDSKAILSLDYAKDLETLLNNTQALAVNNASEGV